jgi:hypothetical protein
MNKHNFNKYNNKIALLKGGEIYYVTNKNKEMTIFNLINDIDNDIKQHKLYKKGYNKEIYRNINDEIINMLKFILTLNKLSLSDETNLKTIKNKIENYKNSNSKISKTTYDKIENVIKYANVDVVHKDSKTILDKKNPEGTEDGSKKTWFKWLLGSDDYYIFEDNFYIKKQTIDNIKKDEEIINKEKFKYDKIYKNTALKYNNIISEVNSIIKQNSENPNVYDTTAFENIKYNIILQKENIEKNKKISNTINNLINTLNVRKENLNNSFKNLNIIYNNNVNFSMDDKVNNYVYVKGLTKQYFSVTPHKKINYNYKIFIEGYDKILKYIDDYNNLYKNNLNTFEKSIDNLKHSYNNSVNSNENENTNINSKSNKNTNVNSKSNGNTNDKSNGNTNDKSNESKNNS